MQISVAAMEVNFLQELRMVGEAPTSYPVRILAVSTSIGYPACWCSTTLGEARCCRSGVHVRKTLQASDGSCYAARHDNVRIMRYTELFGIFYGFGVNF